MGGEDRTVTPDIIGNRPYPAGGPQPGNLASGLDSPAPRPGADLITLERLSGQQLFDPLGCGALVDTFDSGKLAH